MFVIYIVAITANVYNLDLRLLRCALDNNFYGCLSVTYGILKGFLREHWLNATIKFVDHDITEMGQELPTLPKHLS